MYDVVNGEMFSFAMGIYNQFFKNGQMSTDSANIENSLRDLNAQGRKFSDKGKPFHRPFQKVTIFHFYSDYVLIYFRQHYFIALFLIGLNKLHYRLKIL